MRHGHICTLLIALAAPVAVRAQEPPQPIPIDKKCSVPVDKDWTPQEQFVWERVCIGEAADFNDGSSFGGKLDPKKADGWSESRVLRSAFVETILLKDQYRRALTRAGVRIYGARFTESLELQGAKLQHALGFFLSRFEKGVELGQATSAYPVAFSGSKIEGHLNLNGVRFDGSLHLSNGAEFGSVELINARVGSQLNLQDSKVLDRLDMNGVHVGQSLFMRSLGGIAEFGDVVLIAAHIGGDLDLIGAKANGSHDCERIEVKGGILLGYGAEFAIWINLAFAKIGTNIDPGGGTFHRDVDLTGAQIAGELHLGSERRVARWSDNSTLTLRNARVDAIQDSPDAWAPRLELTGFSYRSGELVARRPSRPIYRTEKTRHLFAHRGGMVDRKFRDEMKDFPEFESLVIGERLRLTGRVVTEHVDACVKCGTGLVRAVDTWVVAHDKSA
jgi:hypothetical protein